MPFREINIIEAVMNGHKATAKTIARSMTTEERAEFLAVLDETRLIIFEVEEAETARGAGA